MRRQHLSAIIPTYEVAVRLASGIRLFDKKARIAIQEGRNTDGAWIFSAEFILKEEHIRYVDLYLIFKNSVESVGGKIVL